MQVCSGFVKDIIWKDKTYSRFIFTFKKRKSFPKIFKSLVIVYQVS